jgi:hypothetical protein
MRLLFPPSRRWRCPAEVEVLNRHLDEVKEDARLPATASRFDAGMELGPERLLPAPLPRLSQQHLDEDKFGNVRRRPRGRSSRGHKRIRRSSIVHSCKAQQ